MQIVLAYLRYSQYILKILGNSKFKTISEKAYESEWNPVLL